MTVAVSHNDYLLIYKGTSRTSRQAAFREHFSKLHEMRSLVPTSTPFVALTATATQETKETILSSLLMTEFVEVSESPDKANLTYSVQYMHKDMKVKRFIYNGLLTDLCRMVLTVKE